MCGEASRAASERRKRARAGSAASAPVAGSAGCRAHASAAGSAERAMRRVIPLVGPAPARRRAPRARPSGPVDAAGRAAADARRAAPGRASASGFGRAAGIALAGHDVGRRSVAGRPADQADRGLVLAGERAVVRVVEPAERLVVGGVVAARVVRAAPEHVPGPAGAARDEMAVAVLRAGHLERQRIGRRRAVLLDVVAVGVARAADERAEPAASCRPGCPRRTWGRPRRSPAWGGGSSPGSGRLSLCSG